MAPHEFEFKIIRPTGTEKFKARSIHAEIPSSSYGGESGDVTIRPGHAPAVLAVKGKVTFTDEEGNIHTLNCPTSALLSVTRGFKTQLWGEDIREDTPDNP